MKPQALLFSAALLQLVLIAGCGGAQPRTAGDMPALPMQRPAAPVTALVSYSNKTDHFAKLYVEWSYAGSPIWQVEHADCVAPKHVWNTEVLYNKPDSGPQIRIFARVMDNSTCSGLLSEASRFVAFGDLKFKNDKAKFTAEIFPAPQVHYVLCARGDGYPEKCDADNGYPPEAKRAKH